MNTHAIAKNYGCLTPEERFRLILAASGRGDEAERDRLANASLRVTLTVPDHLPCAQAFHELAWMFFIELVEDAARYFELFALPDDVEGATVKVKSKSKMGRKPAKHDAGKSPAWQRSLDLALAVGFVLRTKAEGWMLFCERLNVPPLLLWEEFPGFDRFQRALALTEKAAFAPEGMLGWLNRIRPTGKPEWTEVPLTVAGVADATAEAFRRRAQWWRGREESNPRPSD